MKSQLKLFLIAVLYLLCFENHSFTQTAAEQKQVEAVKEFLSFYNTNNYKELEKTLFLPGRLLLNASKLEEALAEPKSNWGKFFFQDVIRSQAKQIYVHVRSEIDTTSQETFYFKFNKRNKVKSFFIVPQTLKFAPQTPQLKRIDKQREIDSIMNYKAKYGNFNGCILIIYQNEVLYENCLGYTNFESQEKLNSNSIFYLASCTKIFTAYAIMKLVEQGKCALDDPIVKYFPQFPYNNMEIQHLLNHTSGLPEYFDFVDQIKGQISNVQLIELYCTQKPKLYFKPGKRFEYTNMNYVLLAGLLEQISGLSFKQFFEQYVFQPFNITDITVAGVLSGKGKSNTVQGYAFNTASQHYLKMGDSSEVLLSHFDNIYGDGNLNLSLDQLKKWELGNYTSPLLNEKSLRHMTNNTQLKNGTYTNYGFGFILNPTTESSEKFHYHSGGWYGFHNMMLRFPEQKSSIVILTNNQYPSLVQLTQMLGDVMQK